MYSYSTITCKLLDGKVFIFRHPFRLDWFNTKKEGPEFLIEMIIRYVAQVNNPDKGFSNNWKVQLRKETREERDQRERDDESRQKVEREQHNLASTNGKEF